MDSEKEMDSAIFMDHSLEDGGGGWARFNTLESLTVWLRFSASPPASLCFPPLLSNFDPLAQFQPDSQVFKT